MSYSPLFMSSSQSVQHGTAKRLELCACAIETQYRVGGVLTLNTSLHPSLGASDHTILIISPIISWYCTPNGSITRSTKRPSLVTCQTRCVDSYISFYLIHPNDDHSQQYDLISPILALNNRPLLYNCLVEITQWSNRKTCQALAILDKSCRQIAEQRIWSSISICIDDDAEYPERIIEVLLAPSPGRGPIRSKRWLKHLRVEGVVRPEHFDRALFRLRQVSRVLIAAQGLMSLDVELDSPNLVAALFSWVEVRPSTGQDMMAIFCGGSSLMGGGAFVVCFTPSSTQWVWASINGVSSSGVFDPHIPHPAHPDGSNIGIRAQLAASCQFPRSSSGTKEGSITIIKKVKNIKFRGISGVVRTLLLLYNHAQHWLM